MSEIDKTTMVYPGTCPSCGEAIIVNIAQEYPEVGIQDPEEAPEEIKELIEIQNDSTQNPEAA